jgi:hypothetical protein
MSAPQVQDDPWGAFKDAPKDVMPAPAASLDDPWGKFKDAPAKASVNWSDVPGQALSNLPSSAANFAHSIVQPILHPIDTVGNLADLAAGGLRAGAKAVLPENVFKVIDNIDSRSSDAAASNERIQKTAGAVGEHFADRYGSVEGFKRAIASDPVGVLADASLAATGGGSMAGRLPGVVGHAGKKVAAVGSAIDPLRIVGKAVAKVGGTAASSLGVTTGAGERSFKEAFQAGKTGNEAFTDHMRGLRPIDDVVNMADNAVSQMGRDRGAAYKAGIDSVKISPNWVNTNSARQSIASAADDVYHMGQVIDKNAAKALEEINDIVNRFESISPRGQMATTGGMQAAATGHPMGRMTAETADAMKRAIGEVWQRAPFGTLERKVAGNVYNSIKSEITRQVPEYAQTMKDYSNASDAIGEMRRTMSINPNATTDTTLRKLQSTMRNNVNTNYGQREKLLDTLAQHQPDLPAALAGQSLNTVAPRGLARISPMTVIATGGASLNPATLAMLPFTSPRLMGEASYAAGATARKTNALLRAIGISPTVAAAVSRGSYTANTGNRQNETPRDRMARMMMQR